MKSVPFVILYKVWDSQIQHWNIGMITVFFVNDDVHYRPWYSEHPECLYIINIIIINLS